MKQKKYNLTKIRKNLKKGDRTTIAFNTGYSPSYVGRVLNGERYNQYILDFAKDYR